VVRVVVLEVRVVVLVVRVVVLEVRVVVLVVSLNAGAPHCAIPLAVREHVTPGAYITRRQMDVSLGSKTAHDERRTTAKGVTRALNICEINTTKCGTRASESDWATSHRITAKAETD
jgi:hypothetical protein